MSVLHHMVWTLSVHFRQSTKRATDTGVHMDHGPHRSRQLELVRCTSGALWDGMVFSNWSKLFFNFFVGRGDGVMPWMSCWWEVRQYTDIERRYVEVTYIYIKTKAGFCNFHNFQRLSHHHLSTFHLSTYHASIHLSTLAPHTPYVLRTIPSSMSIIVHVHHSLFPRFFPLID